MAKTSNKRDLLSTVTQLQNGFKKKNNKKNKDLKKALNTAASSPSFPNLQSNGQSVTNGKKKGKKYKNLVAKEPMLHNLSEVTLTKKPLKISKKKVPKLIEASNSKLNGGDNLKDAKTDCYKIGLMTLKKVISPIEPKDFFKNYWEKKPLLIQRGVTEFYDGLLTTSDLHKMFKNSRLQFGKNIDVTSYKDGIRETHNPEGYVTPSVIWDLYNSGCSIRFLNPQTYHLPVWELLEKLQEYFGSFCGSNIYLTPPGTQGFAPHWDDIEAFVIQLEGKKRWRVYKPRSDRETLPRESSGNFGPEDELGEPIIDTVLETGDFLYFPRGFIHQGNALPDCHSMHITLSTYQKTAWVDFMEKLLPECLPSAAESVQMRTGLPIGYLNHTGLVNSMKDTEKRRQFVSKAKELFSEMLNDESIIDRATDQMAKDLIHCSLPPALSVLEKHRTVFDGGEFWSKARSKVVNQVELSPDTEIRITRRGCLRLVVEVDSTSLYYTLDNSREYKAEELKFLEVEDDMVPAICKLIHSYPNYMRVEDLPIDKLDSKMTLAVGLWEKGLVMTRDVLEPIYDD